MSSKNILSLKMEKNGIDVKIVKSLFPDIWNVTGDNMGKRREGSMAWALQQVRQEAKVNYMEEKEMDRDVTFKDLEGRYLQFCSYINEPGYKAKVFEMWGLGHIGSSFTDTGWQIFEEIKEIK